MAEIEEKIIPPDWGKDSLSEFIDGAHHNTLATFSNLKAYFTRLRCINDTYKKITDHLLNTPEPIPGFLLLRAHSSYLGAVRLALSGQIPETYMVLRGCLENSLYALHIARVPDTGEIWLRRHDNAATLKQCKNIFRIGNMFKTLELENKTLLETTRYFYEKAIDYGGHPNQAALLSIMTITEDQSNRNFKIPYLISHELQKVVFDLCLKNTESVGVCSLMIFKLIFGERFNILGISDYLEKLKVGL